MSLTDAKVRAAKPQSKPYEIHDGDGLSLVVYARGNKTWRLRYVARSGKRRRVTLGRYPEVTIVKARSEAAKLRSLAFDGADPAAEIAAARASQRAESVGLQTVVDLYVAENRPTWKDTTARTYLSAINTFKTWAESARVKAVVDVTPEALAKFRAHAVTLTRRAKAKGGTRKDVVNTGERRSAAAINCDLRAVKTMLQTLRKAGRLPAISSADQITDNLNLLSLEQSRPDPLRPAQLRKLLAACVRHDQSAWPVTRHGEDGPEVIESRPRHEPIGPLAVVMLLSGMRLGEALRLTWDDVDLEDRAIRVLPGKTGRERVVDLTVSPGLVRLLAAMRERRTGEHVFSHTQATALDARMRLLSSYGAPSFLWSTRHSRPGERSAPTLRSSCGCYLTCAPAIFGAASVYRSAAQLGHSVQVAERHYLGTLRRISSTATTVEAAMEIEDALDDLISQFGGT